MTETARPILVVDDDTDVREAIRDTLQDEGYPVAEASGGHEALRYLRSNPLPSVIFLDWNMAPMNAPQFMLEFDKEPAFAKVPVVLVTADARADDKVKTARYDGFLRKPVDLQRLFQVAARYATR